MSTLPQILCVGAREDFDALLLESLAERGSVVFAADARIAEQLRSEQDFVAIVEAPSRSKRVASRTAPEASPVDDAARAEKVLAGIADGVVLVDGDNDIVWANSQFRQWAISSVAIDGIGFYKALGGADILGPDFCPFIQARRTGRAATTIIRSGDQSRYFQLRASRFPGDDAENGRLVVALRDVSAETIHQLRMGQIREAGRQLADLKPTDLSEMTVDERVELLKNNILHYTQDLLNYNVVEIRLLDHATNRLEPLLAEGIDLEAARRTLYAEAHGNGVTGFVAATAKSYLCEDTTRDPLYLDGLQGARSSLTVPLVLNDEVIGTFNVESPENSAFTDADLQLVEQFARDLALALNTLELLIAQQANTAKRSVDAIHAAVASPIDEILNDTVNVIEHYIGHDPAVVRRLQSVLRHARDIKQVIQQVGREMAPAKAIPLSDEPEVRPLLVNRRILVVDADRAVRDDAHQLLERYGCVVETAHEGAEAVLMVRNCSDQPYDAVIADIRLPDFSGYQLMLRLKELMEQPPIVLMTGFGWDPGHSIVKARQAGLPAYAILYKPFRLEQLLETVEKVIGQTQPAGA
ncbi:MAG TPA: response regulator [Pirellulaceae bacterium]|nr:response regulator [Pirellulaceae bacterium]